MNKNKNEMERKTQKIKELRWKIAAKTKKLKRKKKEVK